MATSILIHKTGQSPFFAQMASGKARLVTVWLNPPFSILPLGNGPYLVLLPGLCLGTLWNLEFLLGWLPDPP